MSLGRARRRWILALLGISFICNAGVLFLPFMRLRVGFASEPYTLLRSVAMLWDSSLYLLALLVLAFSVVFPFVKLAMLFQNAWLKEPGDRHLRRLHAVERLGKWSMLDVFLVCIVLTLTSGQLLVGARPMPGLAVFVCAILLSMTAGELLSAGLRHGRQPAAMPATPRLSRMIPQAVILAATLTLPFIRISDWKLADNSYSVVTVVPTLWSAGAPVSAAVTAAFLIVAPVAACLLGLIAICRPGFAARKREMLRRWSMLDVFGLALGIFIVEGDYLMRTEVRAGAAALVALVLLTELSAYLVDYETARKLAAKQAAEAG